MFDYWSTPISLHIAFAKVHQLNEQTSLQWDSHKFESRRLLLMEIKLFFYLRG